MSVCTPETLLAHPDAIDHTVARGGDIDDRTGERRALDQSRRERWARDTALFRATALAEQEMEP